LTYEDGLKVGQEVAAYEMELEAMPLDVY